MRTDSGAPPLRILTHLTHGVPTHQMQSIMLLDSGHVTRSEVSCHNGFTDSPNSPSDHWWPRHMDRSNHQRTPQLAFSTTQKSSGERQKARTPPPGTLSASSTHKSEQRSLEDPSLAALKLAISALRRDAEWMLVCFSLCNARCRCAGHWTVEGKGQSVFLDGPLELPDQSVSRLHMVNGARRGRTGVVGVHIPAWPRVDCTKQVFSPFVLGTPLQSRCSPFPSYVLCS